MAKKTSRILTATLVTLTAALFALSGSGKFLNAELWTANFVGWGYPAAFAYVTGALQLLGALLVLHPKTRWTGAGLLTAIMTGAILTHLLNHEYLPALFPVPLALLAATLAWRALPPPLKQAVTSRRPVIAE